MEPQVIKGILQGVISRAGLNERMEECKALLLWNDVVPSLTIRTEPVGISRGRMLVNVTDSVVLHQMTFYKNRYIEEINRMLGKRVVRDIVFRVGEVKKRVDEDKDDYIQRFHSVELSQDELTRIEEIIAKVEDDEIRDSLRELFVNQSKLFKLLEEV